MKWILIDDDPEEIEIFGYAVSSLSNPPLFCGYTDFDTAMDEMLRDMEALPDLIFLDGFMHRINGDECLRKLKANEVLKHISVIIYTGFISDKHRENIIGLGAADILVKPRVLAELKAKLEDLTGP